MLVNREGILIKTEATYNVDPTPATNVDSLLVQEPSWAHEGLRIIDRPAVRASLGTLKPVYGGTLKTISFNVEIKGAGAVYSASVLPEMAPALRACAFAENITVGAGTETVTYLPASTGHQSVTIHYYQDGKRYIMTGCRGNVSFALEVGTIPMASFTFTGHAATPTDVALPTFTYDSIVPPVILGQSFTIDSYAAVISSISLDMGNTIATPASIAASDGYGEIIITKRNVTGSIDPEDIVVGTHDFISKFRTGAAMALTSGLIGSAQYNRLTFTNPALTYTDVSLGDRDGLRIFELPFMAAESATDDEISIAFT